MTDAAGTAGSATAGKAIQEHPLRRPQTEGQVFSWVNLRVRPYLNLF